jgi:hypothetical protein
MLPVKILKREKLSFFFRGQSFSWSSSSDTLTSRDFGVGNETNFSAKIFLEVIYVRPVIVDDKSKIIMIEHSVS